MPLRLWAVVGLLAAFALPIELTGVSTRMVLGASHGYTISIEGSDGSIALAARSRSGAEAEYRVRGLVSKRRLKANLGRFGFVSVRFGGAAPVRRSRREPCARETETLERGEFTGTIRFRGEDAYTSVSASGARGSVATSTALLCPGSGRVARRPGPEARPGAPKGLHTTVLGAGRRREGRGSGFLFESSARAGEPSDSQVAFINAQAVERRGRMEIERKAVFQAPARSLTVRRSGRFVTGTVKLPPPFTGEAEFTATPGEEPMTWDGDLRVPLPGEPAVPLAGPWFHSILCRGGSHGGELESCSADANFLFSSALTGEP